VVIGWLEKHPEFQTRDLWLSGESYAGIYLPYLLKNIDTYN
jgi:carboxypeptidase C (cathepsin A)